PPTRVRAGRREGAADPGQRQRTSPELQQDRAVHLSSSPKYSVPGSSSGSGSSSRSSSGSGSSSGLGLGSSSGSSSGSGSSSSIARAARTSSAYTTAHPSSPSSITAVRVGTAGS